MPLFQYFGWVGSFLLAVLFAVSWWFSVSIAPTPASDATSGGNHQPRLC